MMINNMGRADVAIPLYKDKYTLEATRQSSPDNNRTMRIYLYFITITSARYYKSYEMRFTNLIRASLIRLL